MYVSGVRTQGLGGFSDIFGQILGTVSSVFTSRGGTIQTPPYIQTVPAAPSSNIGNVLPILLIGGGLLYLATRSRKGA